MNSIQKYYCKTVKQDFRPGSQSTILKLLQKLETSHTVIQSHGYSDFGPSVCGGGHTAMKRH